MSRLSLLSFSIIVSSSFLFGACVHDLVKIIDRDSGGGVISYTQPSWINGNADESTLKKQFHDAATELCGSRPWVVTKEVIPMPEASSALRNAANLDIKGAAYSGSSTYQRDRANRDAILNPKADVEYGTPFQTGNQAHVKCEKSKK